MDLQTLYYLASIYYLGTQPPYLSVSTRCTPKPDPGPCKNLGRRYFYNKTSDACEAFEYGGCYGNTNNFITKKDCIDTCKRPLFTKLQVCALQPDKGFCDDKIHRFHYNIVTNKCEKFLYGGCGGNENNFMTDKECTKECGEPLSSLKISNNAAICTMQPEVGPCSEYKPRYYYSWLTGRCEVFLYGSCGGNRNNFKTMTECDDACGRVKYSDLRYNRCALKPEWAPCVRDNEKNFYYYSPERGKCVKSQGRGCPQNGNNFLSEEHCIKSCRGMMPKNSSSVHVCALNPIAGVCLAFMPRYFYNITAGRCDQFLYGGCQKNDNNFKTAAECYGRCAGKQPSVRKCVIQPDAGPCSAHAPRYYFNITQERCERFNYGGCGGNENSFDTNAICMENCEHYGVVELNPCYLEPEKGPCTRTIYRYYFNPTKLRCERFIYGGCGGNRNNFRSEDECAKLCNKYVIVPVGSIARCSLQPLAGSCKNFIVRYFYNMTSRSCESFLYRGCGGNDNNFMTMEQCQAVCAGVSYPEEIWKSGAVNFYSNWYNYYKNEPSSGSPGGNDINYIPSDYGNDRPETPKGDTDYSTIPESQPNSFLHGKVGATGGGQQDQAAEQIIPYQQLDPAAMQLNQQQQEEQQHEEEEPQHFAQPQPPLQPYNAASSNPYLSPARVQRGYQKFA